MTFFSARVHNTEIGGKVREPTKVIPQRLRQEESKSSMSASSKTKLPELRPVTPPPMPIPIPGPTDHEVSQFVPSGAKFLKASRKPTAALP